MLLYINVVSKEVCVAAAFGGRKFG
jgi:hypothetical protein